MANTQQRSVIYVYFNVYTFKQFNNFVPVMYMHLFKLALKMLLLSFLKVA